MKSILKFTGLWVLLLGSASAAPEISAILNAASYALPGMPNSAIAQGSIFVVFGTDLGPAEFRQASGFPLPASLGGTSVQVTVGTTTMDALLLYAWERQVAAILPSGTPTGIGLLAVTYEGRTSQSGAFRIVRSAPGILAQNQAGSGPALAQNFNSAADQPRNSLSRPVRPGQVVTLWGTGLGPVPDNEAVAPVPRDMDINLQVLAGGKPATVRYKGRSGCCAGVDQIIFEVPQGVEGCYVPVVVRAGEATSNFTTISVAAPGSDCTDLSGIPGPLLERLQGGGDFRFGLISLTAYFDDEDRVYYEWGQGSFARDGLARVAERIGLPSPGSCVVSPPRASAAIPSVRPIPLDAGAVLNLSGPKGTRQLARRSTGSYSEQFSSGPQLQYLEPGTYTVDNGSGGTDVGPFRWTLTVPPKLTSTVQQSPAGATVSWRGGDPANYVTIRGSAQSPTTGARASFVCTERLSAGQFTVPSFVLSSLPASPDPTGPSITVGSFIPSRFRAPGLDLGDFSVSIQ